MLTFQAEVDKVGTQKSEPLFCLIYHPQETPEAAKCHLVFDPHPIPPSRLAIWIACRHSGGRGLQMGSGLRGAWRKGLQKCVCVLPSPSIDFG